MNRTMRRKAGITQQEKTLVFTESTLESHIKERMKVHIQAAVEATIRKTIHDVLNVISLCLRDKLRFGHIRTKRFLNAISEMHDDVYKNRLSLEDIKKTLKEEIDIVIK